MQNPRPGSRNQGTLCFSQEQTAAVYGTTKGWPLAILAIEEIAHRSSPSLVRFRQSLTSNLMCSHGGG